MYKDTSNSVSKCVVPFDPRILFKPSAGKCVWHDFAVISCLLSETCNNSCCQCSINFWWYVTFYTKIDTFISKIQIRFSFINKTKLGIVSEIAHLITSSFSCTLPVLTIWSDKFVGPTALQKPEFSPGNVDVDITIAHFKVFPLGVRRIINSRRCFRAFLSAFGTNFWCPHPCW